MDEWPSIYDARVKALQYSNFREFTRFHLETCQTWDLSKPKLERRMLVLTFVECCLKFNKIVFKKYQIMVDILIAKLVEHNFPDKDYLNLFKRLSKKEIRKAKLMYIEWVLNKTILTTDCVKCITAFVE
jgi:hypothetical protein